MCECTCVICVGARGQSQVSFPRKLFSLLLRQSLSLSPKAHYYKPASPRDPPIFISETLEYKCETPYLAFYLGAKDQT